MLAPYRDSGDLVASAFSMGIAHPPGYGLYTLMTKIGMTIFPFGNFAYRANFLSALWSSIAAGLLFKTLKKFFSAPSALFAILIWFFSPAVIQLSIVSEMYTLNALFCSIVIYLTTQAVEGDFIYNLRLFALSFFMIGIGLANQPTIVFLAPGLLFYWWFLTTDTSHTHSSEAVPEAKRSGARALGHKTKWLSMRRALFYFSLFGVLGFSVILFYPIRSLQEPLINWDAPKNMRALWRLITRADLGTLKLHPEESHLTWTLGNIVDQIELFFRAELIELKWWGMLLSVIGLFLYLVRRKKISFTAISFLIAGPLFCLLSNLPVGERTTLPILQPYWVMANLFMIPWIALSAETFFCRLDVSPLHGWKFFRTLVWGVLFLLVLFFSLPVSRRYDFYAYDYGKNLLKTMPMHSSLYDPDDMTAFSISYLQVVEKLRKDIAPLMTLKTFWGAEQLKKRFPEIVPEGNFRSAQEFIPALLSYHVRIQRPLFSDHPSKFPASAVQFPVGILSQVGVLPSAADFEERQRIFNFYIERGNKNSIFVDRQEDFFTRHILSRMSAALNNIGIQAQNLKDFQRAEHYFRQALLRQADLSEGWNNLGINFYLQGDYVSAEKIFHAGIKRAPKEGSLYYHLALTQRKMGKKEDAKSSLQQALKLNPQNLAALNDLGLIFLDENNWVEARLLFESCAKIQENYAPAHYNLGLVYKFLGLNDAAAKSFENYLRFSPNAEDAPQVQKWILALRQ